MQQTSSFSEKKARMLLSCDATTTVKKVRMTEKGDKDNMTLIQTGSLIRNVYLGGALGKMKSRYGPPDHQGMRFENDVGIWHVFDLYPSLSIRLSNNCGK